MTDPDDSPDLDDAVADDPSSDEATDPDDADDTADATGEDQAGDGEADADVDDRSDGSADADESDDPDETNEHADQSADDDPDDGADDDNPADDGEDTDADGQERVATGILAAERRAQTQIARRRRFLIGGAVLGLVLAGAWLATTTVLQQQANEQARQESARSDARAAFAMAVVDAAEAHERPAAVIETEAPLLRGALEEFLVATPRSDDEIAADARATADDLLERAATIQVLVDEDVPEPDVLIADTAAVEVLRELETLRAEAGALASEVDQAVDAARDWAGTVPRVNEALARYRDQVQAEPETSDREELIAQWGEERPPLRALLRAARTADDIPGLEPWAGAHEQYAQDVLDWTDEAVELLSDGDITGYNERFAEVFGADDPFGFRSAVAAAVPAVLESPVLLDLGRLETRAGLVLEAVTTTERTVARVLADGDDTPSDDTPSDGSTGDGDTRDTSGG